MTAPVTVTFLGGLGDIGRNCAVLEHDGRLVVLDCGVLFAGPNEPGVDVVLPDLDWLEERAEAVEAVVFTHGHEDHVGAVVPLCRIVDAPMYGSPFTLALARHKLTDAGMIDGRKFVEVHDNERVPVGPFEAEFLPITHSIPWGFATAFHTPQGVILHSGDFKLDEDPVDGRMSDLGRIGDLAADPGVRLLLADSTNVLDEGTTGTERSVGQALLDVVRGEEGRRVTVACFSSHLHRIQQAVDAAVATGRVVCPVGRSLVRNVKIARELGLLDLTDDQMVDPDRVHELPPGDVMVLTTGSQGERMAGLALMARGDHRHLAVGEDDTVIFSSSPIPGNEHGINVVVDGLSRRGAKIVDTRHAALHVSGHARRGEIRELLKTARPEWFVPVHGEYVHLRAHRELAAETGVADDHALMATDGERVVLADDDVHVERVADAHYLFVHGSVDDVSEALLIEREILGREGQVTVVAVVDPERNELRGDVEIATRGWVDRELSAGLVEELVDEVSTELRRVLAKDPDAHLERVLRRTTGRWVSDRTRRRPMIVPVLLRR